MSKREKALKLFANGFNCSQAVLAVFAGDYSLPDEDARRIAVSFGGGMGRMQQTCGAVTGALMVIGLHCSQGSLSNADTKRDAYDMTQKFMKRFACTNKTTSCRELLGVDLSTEEGNAAVKRDDLFNMVCPRLIDDAVSILEEILPSKNK